MGDVDGLDRGRLFEQLLETTPDVLWTFSRDWDDLVFVSDAYEEVWGRPVDALEEDPSDFLEGVHPDDRDRVREAMDALSGGESVELEYRVNAEEEFQRWVSVRGEPVRDEGGEVVHVSGFARDVTDRRRRERQLTRQNERLDEFASVVSHDLRNPLNVARGYLDRYRETGDASDLDRVDDALSRMDDMIANVLALAREGRVIDDPEPVPLDGLVATALSGTPLDEDRLSVDGELPTVRADPDRLCALFENLFRNAAHHGGPEVSVRVGALEDGLYVEDDGPGIPPDEREAVFDAGYSTAADGTGVGLHVVESVADAHGWSVRATESRTGGARVEITGVTVVD
ncbi:MAG: sensor histidine kinase [Halobacteriaceae archaeon]